MGRRQFSAVFRRARESVVWIQEVRLAVAEVREDASQLAVDPPAVNPASRGPGLVRSVSRPPVVRSCERVDVL